MPSCARKPPIFKVCLVFVQAAILWSFLLPGYGEEKTLLKPDQPKLDKMVEAKPPGKEVGALKGGVRHTRRHSGLKGGSRKGRLDRRGLKGGASDRRLSTQVQSSIGIIGVKFVMYSGRPPVINRIFPGTPAAGSDLKLKDVIVAVDGIPTFGLTKDEVYDMIVGTPGTPVTLSVRSPGDDFRVVTVKRMDINMLTDPFVRRDYMISM